MDSMRLTVNRSVSLVIADVYFSNIEYLDIKQIPAMTLENFVSNIGGAMGLWTGASIVTLIHLVYFCIRTVCGGRKKTMAARRISRKRNRGSLHKNGYILGPIVF